MRLCNHVRGRMPAALDMIVRRGLDFGHALADCLHWIIDHWPAPNCPLRQPPQSRRQNNGLPGLVKVNIIARCPRSHFCPIRSVPESRCGVTGTGKAMKSVCLVAFATALSFVTSIANAEMASIYGGRDGLCGSRTANGERLNCAALTAAHRKWRFGTLVRVCHDGCVTVRINDRGPWVKGRDIDLSPAAGKAIGISSTGHVTLSTL